MKSLTLTKNYFQKLMLAFVLFAGNMIAFAQDATRTVTTDGGSATSTSTTTTTENWYANPIYLAVGALILIILIALIARGNRRD